MTTVTPADSGPAAVPAAWSPADSDVVRMLRGLAMDAVQKVGNGHPGTAMSLAPAAYWLFQHHLRHDPTDPLWLGRDRFVLSMGHSSLTLYLQLYASGYPMALADLEALRTWGSQTPGHPEWGHTPGVETTTGPLGQGVANAVGMALAQRRIRGLFDPQPPPGESPFDYCIYAFASDGDLEEGVSAEAASLAGTQELGAITLVWDDNHISIEDDTSIAFTEDVPARFAAYGWQVQEVELGPDGDLDVAAFDDALRQARAETSRPSFIALHSQIGFPAPHARNTFKAHGSALGADEVAATKTVLGLDPDVSFAVDEAALAHARDVGRRGRARHEAWLTTFQTWQAAHPDAAAELDRMGRRELPPGWEKDLPRYDTGSSLATRSASGAVINALAPHLPELWGGSADLAGSNDTIVKGAPSALPTRRSSALFPGDPYGRNLHFGVREHAMGSIANGIALEGHTRPYVATFLVFSDYMRGSVRMAAIMGLPVVYVWTHDSIGVGEDGPTHQPVEHLTALRAIPGLNVVRPGDANETAAAWCQALRTTNAPTALALSRQGMPVLPGTETLAAEGVPRGGYVLREATGGRPEAILIGTGSELQLAMVAAPVLEGSGIPTRVVSMPCQEWFVAQPDAYREAVLPSATRARVAVEAGLPMSWWRIVGDAGRVVGIDHFGASADAATLFEQFHITTEAVVDAAHASIAAVAEQR
jgi:transketolase